MPRLSGALAALCLLTACPLPDGTIWVTTDVAPNPSEPITPDASSSGTDAAGPPTTGSTTAAPEATTSTGDTTSTGATEPTSPPTCDAVEPSCDGWTSARDLCAAARSACEETWGDGSVICVNGEQECLASALLPECGCQPAVFPCATKQEDCPEGYAFDGALCRPPCDDGFSLDTGGPLSEECGPPEYATCEDGYCAPHVLVFCL